jgi:hypothetical protein
MEVLSVETVSRGGNKLFRRFHLFVTFEIIQNNVQLLIKRGEDCTMYVGKKSICW